jgi:hypothetical protein
MSISGELITETLEYDGGREVTVYARNRGTSGRSALPRL